MISLFIGLTGLSFFFMWYKYPENEAGKAIPRGQRRQQLGIGLVLFLLAVLDFFVAPLADMLPLLVRLSAGIFLFIFAGKASRQVATLIYYLCALLIMIRGLLEFIGL